VFYVGHVDKSSLYETLFYCNILSKYHHHHHRYEYGLVSHSLASAIKGMMRDYDILIAQLEHLLSCNKYVYLYVNI
jgi:hypothetical protein